MSAIDRANKLQEEITNPQLMAGVYRHYKGGHYLVLGVAEDSDKEGSLMVVYVSLDGMHMPGRRFRVRSIKSWLKPEMVDGFEVERYVYVGD